MNNHINKASRGNEVIKIMPKVLVSLALISVLSGCVRKNRDHDRFNTPTSTTTSDISPSDLFENTEVLTTTKTDHPDYNVDTTNGDRTIVLKNGGEVYIRVTADSAGHSTVYVGSHTDNDSLEYKMPEGTFDIKSFDKK